MEIQKVYSMVGTTGYKTKKSRLDLLEIITKNLHNNF